MTRSRGQFDTRHDDESDPERSDGTLATVREWLAFHRVEFLLACWVGVAGIVMPLLFGFESLALESGGMASEPVRTFFWLALIVGIPLLAGLLVVHGAVDVFRLAVTDAEIGSAGHVVLRVLETGSALVLGLGVLVMVEGTAEGNVEFDPAALLSAFLLAVGLVGMLGTVALDGVVRLVRGNW